MAHVVCEYYDLLECKKDPSYCNSTIECEQPDVGKRLHCYAFLTNSSGVMLLSKKGCWLDDVECYNKSKCIARDDGASNFYCCCEGNMCNANVTISTLKSRLPSSVPKAGQWNYLIIQWNMFCCSCGYHFVVICILR